MSRSSEEDLNYYGGSIAAAAFFGTMLGAALLAIQVFMVLYGQSVLSNAPKAERRSRLPFILVGWAMMIASSINFALSSWDMYLTLYRAGPTGKSYVEYAVKSSADPVRLTRLDIVGDAFLCLAVALGDILMLWRCFELWRDRKWVVLPPFLACIGSIAALVTSFAPIDNDGYTRAIIASVCMSVALNVIVTGLILFRLAGVWLMRRRAMVEGQTPYLYSDVVAILIESAAPLALCGIIFIATALVVLYQTFSDARHQARVVFVRDIFDWLYYGFGVISPQMIIFRVSTGKSWRNAKDRSTGSLDSFSQSMRFTENRLAIQYKSTKDITDSGEASEGARV